VVTKKPRKQKLLIIANNNFGTSQSGGDTIFLEFIKNWQSKLDITVFGGQETQNLLNRYKLTPSFIKTDNFNPHHQPTAVNIIFHNLRRCLKGFTTYLLNYSLFTKFSYCYTVSDFPPDFFIGLINKILHPKTIWISGQYLFAPNPSQKNSPYKNQPIKGWFYYLYQKISLPLARKFANIILVTSAPDISKFPNKKTIIVQGGVDITQSQRYLKSSKIIPVNQRKYDAVYLGRLHPQKGVLELIDIWQSVTNTLPTAKLAIIGDGQLEPQIKSKIKKLKLQKNIQLLGFLTGQQKYAIFKNSKIVVHPATYDSGGMSAAEAMAWGLPGVSFNLESLKTYYPQGIIKSPLSNNQQFAQNIISLLTNQKLYQKHSSQAIKLIQNTWDWQKRSDIIYQQIFNAPKI